MTSEVSCFCHTIEPLSPPPSSLVQPAKGKSKGLHCRTVAVEAVLGAYCCWLSWLVVPVGWREEDGGNY